MGNHHFSWENSGKPSINGPFSTAMLNNQRVFIPGRKIPVASWLHRGSGEVLWHRGLMAMARTLGPKSWLATGSCPIGIYRNS